MAPPHAFLDVLANGQIRDAYLAGRISIILSPDLETILWTNGAGAHFMGLRTVAEAIGVDSGFDRLTRHQIEAGLEVGRPVRVSGMPQSEAFLVNATHLAPLGNVVFLRSVRGQADSQGGVDLIAGLSDETTVAAVFDLDTHVLRASENFDVDWFAPQELRQILRQAHQERRVKKRLLQKNPSQLVGVLALSQEPAIFLLITAKPEVTGEQKAEDEQPFVFNPEILPLQFGWRVDVRGCFEEVSPELAQAVGANYSDILGKSFAQLAREWNMDGDGTLRALFKSHNSWGGTKVHWPVEGIDKRVDITFFALPIYSRAREFIGFRGFALITEIKDTEAQIVPKIGGNGLSPQEYEAFSIIADTLAANLHREENGKEIEPFPKSAVPVLDKNSNQNQEPEGDSEKSAVKTVLSAQLANFSPTNLHLTLPKQGDLNPFVSDGAKSGFSSADIPELSLLQAMPLGILIYRDEKVLFANEHLLQLTGFTTIDAFRTHRILALILREWLPKNMLQRPNGEKMPIRATMRAITWADGQDSSMISFLPDEKRQLDHAPDPDHVAEELRTVRNQAIELSTLLNLVRDGVLIIDTQGIIHSFNESAARIFKLPADFLAGKLFTQFFTAESQEILQKTFEHLRLGGEKKSLDEGILVAVHDGENSQRLLRIDFASMTLDEGYYLMLRDVTDLHILAQQKRQAEQQAALPNEKNFSLLTQISHQIRTPLTAILGLSQLMLTEKYGAINNDRYRMYLRDIASSSDQIIRLLQHLDSSVPQIGGREIFDIKKLALTPLLNDVIAKISPQAKARRVIMRSSLAVDLAPVLVDIEACRQILLGLVTHALQTTASGGQIIISAQNVVPEGVLFRLRDTGSGLSAAEMKAIAQTDPDLKLAWTLADPNRPPSSATTILALVKKLAEANGARFHLRSEPNKGTLVEITFTLA